MLRCGAARQHGRSLPLNCSSAYFSNTSSRLCTRRTSLVALTPTLCRHVDKLLQTYVRSSSQDSKAPAGTPSKEPNQEPPQPNSKLPTAWDGVNWWCYTVLGLLFITDFTPLGPLLLQGTPNAGLYLAAVQWFVFVVPTLTYCRDRGWDLREVLQLRGCSPQWLLAGLSGGMFLWLATAAAIAARTGADLHLLSGAGGDSAVAGVLFSELLMRPNDPLQWAQVMATTALSPAVAEELLYRGFLLTALRQRFGSIDAVALAATLFAAAHLSLPQFFPFVLLGAACGGAVLASGSVLPATVLHAAYNATGIAVGLVTALAARGA